MRHLISLVRQKYRGRERLVLVTSGLAIFALLGVLPLDTTRAEIIDEVRWRWTVRVGGKGRLLIYPISYRPPPKGDLRLKSMCF